MPGSQPTTRLGHRTEIVQNRTVTFNFLIVFSYLIMTVSNTLQNAPRSGPRCKCSKCARIESIEFFGNAHTEPLVS